MDDKETEKVIKAIFSKFCINKKLFGKIEININSVNKKIK